jgi:hypothetical protein
MRFPHILFVSVLLVITIILASCSVFKSSGHEAAVPGDASHYYCYYSEDGQLLKKMPGKFSASFVVKTIQQRSRFYTTEELDAQNNTTTDNTPADAVEISNQLRKRVIVLIKRGDIENDTVKNNIVQIADRKLLCDIRKMIKDNTRGEMDSINNIEYGGVIFENNSFSTLTGPYSDPRKGGAHVTLKHAGKAEYHSHPSGYVGKKPGGNNVPWSETSVTSGDRSFYFMQGPSKTDQQQVGIGENGSTDTTRIGYVFAMRTNMIFIYNTRGIMATLPLDFAN